MLQHLLIEWIDRACLGKQNFCFLRVACEPCLRSPLYKAVDALVARERKSKLILGA